jgi:hypothetical protein
MGGWTRRRAAWAAATGVLLVVLAVLAVHFGDAGIEEKSIAHCRETSDPRRRFQALPAGMAAETLSAEEEAEWSDARRSVEKVGADFLVREINSSDGEFQAIAFVVTLGQNDKNQRDFMSGIAEGAEEMGAPPPSAVDLGELRGGKEYAVEQGGQHAMIVAGYSGCHTLAVFAADRDTARSIAAAMAAGPES